VSSSTHHDSLGGSPVPTVPPQSTTTTSNNKNCETAYLHVIVDNAAAIRFYEKLGFERLREITDYYTIDDEKHNCFLYAKFFDSDSVEKRRQLRLREALMGMGIIMRIVVRTRMGIRMRDNPFKESSIVAAATRRVSFWVQTIWSSIVSYYSWTLSDRRQGGGEGVKYD